MDISKYFSGSNFHNPTKLKKKKYDLKVNRFYFFGFLKYIATIIEIIETPITKNIL
jgi:hypothetical protein